jgi:hypothetical protein
MFEHRVTRVRRYHFVIRIFAETVEAVLLFLGNDLMGSPRRSNR